MLMSWVLLEISLKIRYASCCTGLDHLLFLMSWGPETLGKLEWMISLNPWTGIWLCIQSSVKCSGVVRLPQIPYSEQNLKHSFKSSDERWLCTFFFNTVLIVVTWAFSGRMFSNMNILCLTPVHTSFLEGGCVGKYEISCFKHF